MAGIRFARNVEILVRVLWELLEEQGEKCVDVFASSHGVAHRAAAVRESSVHGLVQEDDRSIRIPRVWIVDNIAVLID